MKRFNWWAFAALIVGIYCGSKINRTTYTESCENALIRKYGMEAVNDLNYRLENHDKTPTTTNVLRSQGQRQHRDDAPGSAPTVRDYFDVPSGENAPFNRFLRRQKEQ